MSYVVLARRYRPQKFSELLGQEHISRTLQNAVKTERVAHAYLFTGPRGVGKTSAARILAKALRCLTPSSDFEPCNECDTCKSINDGSSMDVLEIDAASNTGVDNIRNLRETINYTATVGKYRVYIIDEVHMLSTAAFNALLKTLEEPPPNVVFIFATTEIHKVLPTIISRCQKFDFKKIPPHTLRSALQEICIKEKINIEPAALEIIIQESDGCFRDSQSLLDQAITLCGHSIALSQLESALGLMDRRLLISILSAVALHDPKKAVLATRETLDKGAEPKILLNRLTEAFRELHFRHFAQAQTFEDPDFDPVYNTLLQQLSSDEIVRALDLCLRTQNTLGHSVHPGFAIESLVIKLCLQRPALQTQVAQSPVVHTQVTQTAHYTAPTRTPAPAPAPTDQNLLSKLKDFIQNKKPTWSPILNSLISLEGLDGNVKVTAKNDFAGRRLDSADGKEILKSALGVSNIFVELQGTAASESAPTLNREAQFQEKRKMSREHEAIQAAMKALDATIVETKILEDKKEN